MKTNARSNLRFIAFTVALLSVAILPAATATTPQYQIYDIGVIDAGDRPHRALVCRTAELRWADRFAPAEVRRLPGHSTAASLACRILPGAITRFPTARMTTASWWGLPPPHFSAPAGCRSMWQNGAVSQLPLPPGETLGDANSVNVSSVAVGSVDGGSLPAGRNLQRGQR